MLYVSPVASGIKSGSPFASAIRNLEPFLYSLDQYRDAKTCTEGAIRPAIGELALDLCLSTSFPRPHLGYRTFFLEVHYRVRKLEILCVWLQRAVAVSACLEGASDLVVQYLSKLLV